MKLVFNLKREINDRSALMNSTSGVNVNVLVKKALNVLLAQTSRAFKKEVVGSILPFGPQANGNSLKFLTLEVVKHNDVGASLNGFVGLLSRADLNLNLGRKSSNRASSLNSSGNRSRRPDMVILKHYHR